MATGTGKTRTCIGLVYRLCKAKRFRRVLFLVDRTSLGEQTADAFKDFRLESHQTFADIYDVKELGDIKPEKDTRLQIATIQGMIKRLLFSSTDEPPLPVDQYDCVIVDECHRGYNLDREMSDTEMTFRCERDYIPKYSRVLDHFDAVRIGLTATPALHTTDIFGEPVYTYSYRQAVMDGYLVDHEPPIRIVTELAEDGITWKAGEELDVLDVKSGEINTWDLEDEVEVEIDEFNKRVITESFNRVVCERLARHIDPTLDGTEPPKESKPSARGKADMTLLPKEPLWIAMGKANMTPIPRVPPAARLETFIDGNYTTLYIEGQEPFTFETRVDVVADAKSGAGGTFTTKDVKVDKREKSPSKGSKGAIIDVGDSRFRHIHGGGTGLDAPYADKQGWRPTEGCTRAQNKDVRDLAELIEELKDRYPGLMIPYYRRLTTHNGWRGR